MKRISWFYFIDFISTRFCVRWLTRHFSNIFLRSVYSAISHVMFPTFRVYLILFDSGGQFAPVCTQWLYPYLLVKGRWGNQILCPNLLRLQIEDEVCRMRCQAYRDFWFQWWVVSSWPNRIQHEPLVTRSLEIPGILSVILLKLLNSLRVQHLPQYEKLKSPFDVL